MRLPAFVLAALLAGSGPAIARADGPVVAHDAVGCMVARQFPVLSARIDPAEQVARARVYFRAADTRHWYYVEMKPQGGVFRGTLPRPRKGTEAIEYYIEAVDTASAISRTPDHTPSVVGSAAECSRVIAATTVTSPPSIAVSAPRGASLVPAGFEANGIVAATAAAAGAAAATTAAVAGAGGGGIGATALVVGGVVVAGGAAAAATLGGGDDGDGGDEGGDGDPQCGTVTITGRTATTLTVTWSGGQPTDGVYVVDAAVAPPGADCPVVHEGRQFIVRTTSVVVTGLSPATTYAVHVHPAGAPCSNCDTGYQITDLVGVAIATTLGQ